MTVEQVLVYLLALTAGIFLFLGLAQVLGDRPARARRRRIRTPRGAAWVSRRGGPVEETDVVPTWARRGKADALPETSPVAAPATATSQSSVAGTPTVSTGDGSHAEGPNPDVPEPHPTESEPDAGVSHTPAASSAGHSMAVTDARPVLDEPGLQVEERAADRGVTLPASSAAPTAPGPPAAEPDPTILDRESAAVAESRAEAAVALIRQGEYGAAHAIVQSAVQAGELPAERGEVLTELLGVTFRRDIDRLTAAATRGGRGDSGAAVTGLSQAEALLGAMPQGAIGSAHRAAVTQRIWRGHSKLGFRCLGLGQLDAAADSLFRALGMRDIGRRRQRQVRDALVRTLEGLVDQRAATISEEGPDGRQPAAAEEIALLEVRMRRAREEGVSDEDLEVASSKLERLRQRLDDSTTIR